MRPHMFLEITGVDGESEDEDHYGWIDVLEFQFGADIPSDTGWGGTGRTYGRGHAHNFIFKKYLDRATPALYYSALVGRHYSTAKFVSTKASGAQALIAFEIKFINLNVKQIVTEGTFGGHSPVETVELVYEEIEMNYRLQGDHGAGTTNPRLTWNVQTQKGSVM